MQIALWSGAITLGGFAVSMCLAAIGSVLRGSDKPVDPIGALFGAAVFGAVPVAVILFAGLFASAGLIAIQTPPITYLFIALAAGLCFAASLNRSSYGMEGCTKIFAILWSAYATVWSGLSFLILGGPERAGVDLASLAWLQPLLVAAPYAAAYARVADKKRRTWGKFVVGLVFASAFFALVFLPVQAGLVGRWLPISDWLRFPLAAALVATVIAAVPVAMNALLSTRAVRLRRLRELPGQAGRLMALLVPAGLLWAGTGALLVLLRGA